MYTYVHTSMHTHMPMHIAFIAARLHMHAASNLHVHIHTIMSAPMQRVYISDGFGHLTAL